MTVTAAHQNVIFPFSVLLRYLVFHAPLRHINSKPGWRGVCNPCGRNKARCLAGIPENLAYRLVLFSVWAPVHAAVVDPVPAPPRRCCGRGISYNRIK